MKRKFPIWILFLAIPCVLLAAGYFALRMYYQVKIPYGTWINDIYCTGFSYDEAARLLLEQEPEKITIDVVDLKGVSHRISLEDTMYDISYREGLEKEVTSYNLFHEKHITKEPVITVHREAWEDYVSSLPWLKKPTITSGEERLQIVKEEAGFTLVDTMEQVLDASKASEVILTAIQDGLSEVSLIDSDCYYTPDYTDRDRAVLLEYRALQDFCNTFTMALTINGEVVYDVNASVLKDWMLIADNGEYAVGKDGQFLLDNRKVKEYVQHISREVTTYFGKPWQFVNHKGEKIEVKAGNYGRSLQTDKLYDTLIKAFRKEPLEKPQTSYELEFQFYPSAAKEVGYGGIIGDSYVEVDITGQKVLLYLDGELKLSSDCVTGDAAKSYDTPKGVFYIEYKQKNRVLKGENYRTPVSYWMHFYNHCGFHDAKWRRKFGENIYLKDGSHGCVNMPPEKAKELYELVYKGLPVVIY